MAETSLERVASAVGTLADETRLLMREVRSENEGRKRQNRLLLALVVLTLLGVVGVVAVVVRQGADAAVRSGIAAEQRAAQLRVSEQLNDCVNPGGACYRRSQANQAEAINQLIIAAVVIERCGVRAGDDVAAFDACVKAAGLPALRG
jgi:hypothetical protein